MAAGCWVYLALVGKGFKKTCALLRAQNNSRSMDNRRPEWHHDHDRPKTSLIGHVNINFQLLTNISIHN